MTPEKIVCFKCRYYLIAKSCFAFKEIPDIIFGGGSEHTKPLPKQKNDIVFEPIK